VKLIVINLVTHC